MAPKIKPNAVLKFNVELVSFEEKEKRKDEMTNAERINLSSTFKNNGNECFKSQNFDKAYE